MIHPIHPDPSLAHAIDPSVVRHPGSYPALLERVLARSWQFVGEAPPPGHVAPATLLEGSLDEPVVITHDGRVRVLANVCTHRAARVVSRAGPARLLRCPYHGRCFHPDGRLERAPGFDQAADFPTPADHLTELPSFVLGPMVFASLDPLAHPAPLEAIAARFEGLPVHRLLLDAATSVDEHADAHWLLYVENYLEGLHIPFVHPALTRALDLGAYHTCPTDWGVVQVGVAKEGEPLVPLPEGHPDGVFGPVGGLYWWLHPTTMFNLYPWGISLNAVQPLGPARTRIRYRSYVWEPALRQEGAGAAIPVTEQEDQAIVAEVQRGIRSRFYRPGRLAPGHEAGVHAFHLRLVAALGGQGQAPC